MKKKVGMIAYTTYPFDARVRREAESLAANGYKVLFLAPKESKTARKYYMDGVYVIELNKGKYRGKSQLRYILSYFGFLIKAFTASALLFTRRDLDIVHVHNMPNFLVFAAVVPRLFGKKVILDIHDSIPEMYTAKYENTPNLLSRLFCLEEKLCCRFAHKIICVNQVQRNALTGRGVPFKKIGISMNVPDPKRFNSRTNDTGKMKNSRTYKLVYHGTLVKRLGIDLIIRAVAKLHDSIPGLEFHIIGDGDDVEEYKGLCKRLGVEKNIHFTGYIPVDSLEEVLKGMDVGVIANRKNVATELMLPVKMLEYIALNIPVIAPRLNTIQYYFSEDMLSYFEPEDINSLTERILELFSNEDLRIKQAISARSFLKKYGWEKHEKDFIDIYKSLDGGIGSC